MAIISNPLLFQNLCLEQKSLGNSIGFIPTMGALHTGHLTLVKKSLDENHFTSVSIFVNPTQFDDESDLANYPDQIEQDIEKLEKLGVNCVFTPHAPSIYPDNYKYKVSENNFSQGLCGAHRPGHFDGVLTVVMKLLNLAQANRAYFGEKDYQQLLLIKKMTDAFFIPTEIVSVDTVREKDGLALSSRNLLLAKDEREKAAKLYKIISQAESAKQAKVELINEGFDVDYVEDRVDIKRRFAAAYLGKVRLIDNVSL